MSMRIALHKGVRKGKRGYLFSRLVKRVLKSPFSHIELNFPKEGTTSDFTAGGGMSFSSRGTEKRKKKGGVGKGVQWKKIYYSHPSRWVFVYLPMFNTLKTIKELKRICNKYIGKKYDFIGAFFWAGLQMRVENRKKYWCSEIIAKVLHITNWHMTPEQVGRYFGWPTFPRIKKGFTNGRKSDNI